MWASENEQQASTEKIPRVIRRVAVGRAKNRVQESRQLDHQLIRQIQDFSAKKGAQSCFWYKDGNTEKYSPPLR